MADFEKAVSKVIENEGGYRLHEVAGDRGGMTYAGIARRMWPDWPGWRVVDYNIMADTNGFYPKIISPKMVADFYRENFWDQIHGDHILDQEIAEAVFDFAVNAGVGVAVKAAQRVVGAFVDGIVGQETMTGIASSETQSFLAAYAIERVRHYAGIVNRDRGQSKFLLGWINRTLAGVPL